MPLPTLSELLSEDVDQKVEDQKRTVTALATQSKYEKLPARMRRVVDLVLRNPGMSIAAARSEAGYKPSGSGARDFTKKIQGVLADEFDAAGLTGLDIVEALRDGLKAEKHHIKWIKVIKEGKVVDHKAKVICTPDYKTRAYYAKLAAELGNLMPAQKISVDSKSVHVEGRITDLVELKKRRQEISDEIEVNVEVVNSAPN